MSYRFLENVSLADVAFEARARSLSGLFEESAKAVSNTMVKELRQVKPVRRKVLKLRAPNPEQLLFNFLQELVFLKDAKQLLFSKFDVKIRENKGYALKAVLRGDKLNPKKQELLVDVKAVTWHLFEVRKRSRGWSARVVLDV